ESVLRGGAGEPTRHGRDAGGPLRLERPRRLAGGPDRRRDPLLAPRPRVGGGDSPAEPAHRPARRPGSRAPTDHPRLIVGAGPVGLGAALELARCGVRSTLIEKHESTSWHPKTRNFNTRTMEIARGWGHAVYERLRSIDTPPGWKSPIRFTRTATGEEL